MLSSEFEMEEHRLYLAHMVGYDFESSRVFRSGDKVYYIDNIKTEYASWDYAKDFKVGCDHIEVM